MKPKAPFISKLVLAIMLISVVCSTSQAQSDDDDNFWRHVRYGGGLGLSFGDGFFSGTLAPSAIYEFNPQFALGLGLNGTYSKQRDRFKSTVFGGSVIALFNPINEIQLSAEFEELNVNRTFESSEGDFKDNYWYPALFMGLGYRTGNVSVGIRYDVLYDENKSIYANAWAPFVRVFF